VIALQNLVRTPLAAALGWTLFHTLWEGAVVAAVLFAALYFARSARSRYAASCIAMLAILAGFGITLFLLLPDHPRTTITMVHALPPAPPADSGWMPEVSARLRMDDVLPWLTPFWFAGVILFHLRSLTGWIAARRLRQRGSCLAPAQWQQRLSELQASLRVSAPVLLLESCLAEVPVVIGWLRPVILLPVGLLTGMPVNQIEAILLHELAHIRRRDYLVNLVQVAVESLLFYHPAIWWISGTVRAERENCCDDLVVAASGDAREYATALTALEENRWAANEMALAATGGNLMKRIRRLLDPSTLREGPRTFLTPVLSAGILTITAALALTAWQTAPAPPRAVAPILPTARPAVLVAQAAPAPAQTRSAPAPQASPWERWVKQDVVYIVTDEERKAFSELHTEDEREMFIQQFWERRNPTPGSGTNPFKEEHYRRIAYTNAHFSGKDGLPGWKTDRGRIYITFGPPDEIDSHPSGGSYTKPPEAGGGDVTTYPFEDWRYRWIEGLGNNINIEFVDREMKGEFHMTMDPREKEAR